MSTRTHAVVAPMGAENTSEEHQDSGEHRDTEESTRHRGAQNMIAPGHRRKQEKEGGKNAGKKEYEGTTLKYECKRRRGIEERGKGEILMYIHKRCTARTEME
jgi:hypothetical protein